MPLTTLERAAAAVGAYGRSGDLKALLADFTAQLAEAVDSERQGLRNTLQFCVQVLEAVLALPSVPGELRAAVRACRGLCLASLQEEGQK